MEEVIIPAGKSLRYRCGVEGCSSVNRHFSVISIWEHLASHFAKKNGNRHYNYRCQSCGMHFYNLGMADSCRCPKKTDGRFESIRLDLSSAAIRHDVFFSSYYKRYAIPVLVNDNDASVSRHAPKPDLQRKPSNTKTSQPPPKIPTERSRTPRSSEDPEDSRGMNWPMMRSPSMYADGTPRTPREDDEEEEAEPAYVRAMRSRCQSRAGSPTDMENAGNESAVNSAPPSTNGSQERVSLSQAVENVSKRDTFAWPPPEPTPELLTLSAVRNEPTTSSGHRQDSTPSASEHISPPEPARSQNFKRSSANDGLAQISQADDHFESKASDERRGRKASTVRVPGRRSRQDALLEENPSPPPVSRRRASRSPTPYRRSPSQSRPSTPGNHPQTPATGYYAPDAQEHRDAPVPPNQKVRKQNSSTNEDTSPPVERQRPSSRSANGSCAMQMAGSSMSAIYSDGRKTHAANTDRTPHKRSRQDALLEENPSLPNFGRRVSSSPGPFSRATPANHFNRENDHSGRGGYTPMRSPSQYEDGTCRTPRPDDDEEEDLPAYQRGRKNLENDAKRPLPRTGDKSGDCSSDRPSSRSCSDQENIAPSTNHGPSPNMFGFAPPPQFPPPMFAPPVPNSLPPWAFTPFPGIFPMNGWMPNPVSGIPSFGAPPLVPPPPQPPQLSGSFPPPPSGTIPPPSSGTIPPPPPPPPLPNEHSPSNRATKAGKSSGVESTKNNTAPAAPKPPERVGGSKFLESVPPVPKANTSTTAKRPYQRKRRLSRANGDDSD